MLDTQPEWMTVGEVDKCQTLQEVKLGDDIAIYHHGDEDWTTGIVTKIDTYKDRSTRWKEKRVVSVLPHGGKYNKVFYEMQVDAVLFKG